MESQARQYWFPIAMHSPGLATAEVLDTFWLNYSIENLSMFITHIYPMRSTEYVISIYLLVELVTNPKPNSNKLVLCIPLPAVPGLVPPFQQHFLPSLSHRLRDSVVWQLFAQALETD